EFTAWPGSMAARWTRPGEYTEVVQIGAVKLDVERLSIVDEFEMLARPRLNPLLSQYFIDLTGITNARLAASGVDFVVAYRAFLDFAGEGALWAFGRDDLIFERNLKLYAWSTLPVRPYMNAVHWFAANGVDLKDKHACDVPEAVGLPFTGQKHDALADARGVAAGFKTLIERGAANPFLADQRA